MNLREEILKEHSKQHALTIANYACESNENFEELVKCFLDKEYRLAQRAAWSVSWAARQKPEMIYPHIKDLVSVLSKKKCSQCGDKKFGKSIAGNYNPGKISW